MAQNFRNQITQNIDTSFVDILTAVDSYDAVVGIRLVNTSGNNITVSIKIVRSSSDYFLIKNAEILQGSSLELIDGGSKIVLHSGDKIQATSNADNSLDTAVSYIDAIST